MDILEIAGAWSYTRSYSIDGVDKGSASTSILRVNSSYISTGQKVQEGTHKGAYIWEQTVTITVNAPAGTRFESLSFTDSDWLTVGFQTNTGTQTVTYLRYSDVTNYLSGEVRAYFVSDKPKSAIQIITRSNPSQGGVTTGDGIWEGEVGDTLTVDAQAFENIGWYFTKWLAPSPDEYHTRNISPQFIFKSGYSLANPEVIYLDAYFSEHTSLILYDPVSGKIIYGSKSNSILYDY